MPACIVTASLKVLLAALGLVVSSDLSERLVASGMASLRPLRITLGVDASGEGVLEAQGNEIDKQHPDGQKNTGRLAKDEGGAQEAHGRAVVHGRVGDVEGEARDHVVHQDAEVVAQEGSRDAQGPCRRDDEDVAGGEEGVADVCGQRSLESWVRGLVAQGALVEGVADEAEGENGCGEGVAGCFGIAAEGTGHEVGAVFSTRDDAGVGMLVLRFMSKGSDSCFMQAPRVLTSRM